MILTFINGLHEAYQSLTKLQVSRDYILKDKHVNGNRCDHQLGPEEKSFPVDLHSILLTLVFTRLSLLSKILSSFFLLLYFSCSWTSSNINKYFWTPYKGFRTASVNPESQALGSRCFELLVAMEVEGPNQSLQSMGGNTNTLAG